MKGLAVIAAILSASAAARERPDPWTNEGGVERGKAVIEQCLERDASTPPDGSERCIRIADMTCEDEHGTSQRDLNDCAYFSKSAWEARLAAIRARLMGAKMHPPVRKDPEPMKRMLRENDRRWDEWNRADCEMQSKFSERGTMHPMELGLCLSDHAAHRALELERFTFWWDHAYALPEEKPTGPYKSPPQEP